MTRCRSLAPEPPRLGTGRLAGLGWQEAMAAGSVARAGLCARYCATGTRSAAAPASVTGAAGGGRTEGWAGKAALSSQRWRRRAADGRVRGLPALLLCEFLWCGATFTHQLI